ncbi:MAG: magnesium transporter, partial [Candidatus Bathyarchaeia archaeon]
MTDTANEIALLVGARDFNAVRAFAEQMPSNDLAALLGELHLEEQVIVFRLLPRKLAAAVFEYLSIEEQEQLLKAMAQEDIAAILNEMHPDDRTDLLDELPANITKQMLALLTPEERAVAVKLLGYPEGSIGRL